MVAETDYSISLPVSLQSVLALPPTSVFNPDMAVSHSPNSGTQSRYIIITITIIIIITNIIMIISK